MVGEGELLRAPLTEIGEARREEGVWDIGDIGVGEDKGPIDLRVGDVEPVQPGGVKRKSFLNFEVCLGGLNHLFKRETVEEVNPNLEKQLRQGANVLGGRVPAPVLHKLKSPPTYT